MAYRGEYEEIRLQRTWRTSCPPLGTQKAKRKEKQAWVPQNPWQEGAQDLNLPLGPVTPHSTNVGRKPLTQGPLCNILD